LSDPATSIAGSIVLRYRRLETAADYCIGDGMRKTISISRDGRRQQGLDVIFTVTGVVGTFPVMFFSINRKRDSGATELGPSQWQHRGHWFTPHEHWWEEEGTLKFVFSPPAGVNLTGERLLLTVRDQTGDEEFFAVFEWPADLQEEFPSPGGGSGREDDGGKAEPSDKAGSVPVCHVVASIDSPAGGAATMTACPPAVEVSWDAILDQRYWRLALTVGGLALVTIAVIHSLEYFGNAGSGPSVDPAVRESDFRIFDQIESGEIDELDFSPRSSRGDVSG